MNFQKMKIGAAVVATLMTLGSAAHAVTVNVVTDNSNVLSTDSLTGFATTGAGMAGMVVTANGATSATWQTTGSNSGQAVAGGVFRLSLSGDSFTNDWRLQVLGNSFLTSLTLDGIPGNTVFDLTSNSSTPGSARGVTFGTGASGSGSITATYSNIVALTGDSPVGDLFAKLSLDFSGLSGGGLGRGSYTFTQDTDNASTKLVPVDPVDVVPLPAAGWMLLAGLGGLAAMKRRKKA